MLEDRVKKLIHKTGAKLPDGTIGSMLRRWLVEDKGAVNAFIFEDNRVRTFAIEIEEPRIKAGFVTTEVAC